MRNLDTTFYMIKAMKNVIYAKRWLWMISMAIFLMKGANALVLGDIQVDSKIGQPLNARISIVNLTDADVEKFQARLAGNQDYRRLGLLYPFGRKFHFQLVRDMGSAPFIAVTTEQSLDDPLNDLVLEISSGSGKQIKTYTFLLDPT